MDSNDEQQISEKCDVCGEEFKTMEDVEMHMKKEHPDTYDKLSQSQAL